MRASDFDSTPGQMPTAETLANRKLASLRLVEPLMLATLYRPGISEHVPQDAIIDAQRTLIFRVIHLTDQILDRLGNHSERRAFDRYSVAREIVNLIALHWKAGSELTAHEMSTLAEHAVASGMQLLRDLKEQPYRPGDDAMERLSGAVSASARIMLSLQGRATLGHDMGDLCRKMTDHLAQSVILQAERMKARDSTLAVKSMLRIFSDYYPILWEEEIRAALAKFSVLKNDPEAFQRETERYKIWPLQGFFSRVDDAISGCMDMATAMQNLLEEPSEPRSDSPQP